MSRAVVDQIVELMTENAHANLDEHGLSSETMNAVASHPNMREYISPERAGQVIWVASSNNGGPIEGIEPGNFYKQLIEACFAADSINLGILAMSFPDTAWAVHNYTCVEGGYEWLQKRFKEWKA